jgi:hypothetical protein
MLEASKAIKNQPDEIMRMASEIVRLANENRIKATGREISKSVQAFMYDNLLKSAERPPSEWQAERDRQVAQSRNEPEPRCGSP